MQGLTPHILVPRRDWIPCVEQACVDERDKMQLAKKQIHTSKLFNRPTFITYSFPMDKVEVHFW